MTRAWGTHTYPITILWKSGKLLGFTVCKRNIPGWVVTTMQRNSKHVVPLPVSYCWMRYTLLWYTWYSVERCLLLGNLVHAYLDKLLFLGLHVWSGKESPCSVTTLCDSHWLLMTLYACLCMLACLCTCVASDKHTSEKTWAIADLYILGEFLGMKHF